MSKIDPLRYFGTPRAEVNSTSADCPWCQADMFNDIADDPVVTCSSCGKESYLHAEGDGMVHAGLRTAQDVEYLKASFQLIQHNNGRWELVSPKEREEYRKHATSEEMQVLV